nr:immunoglobulin light chain junction region [Macaca mulatta]
CQQNSNWPQYSF